MDILIVDDEAGIREGLATFLRLGGHRVTTAADAPAAHSAIASCVFDAVVTDWQLGAGSTAESIVRSLGDTPCLVASGYPESVLEVLPEARVLTKPVLPRDLKAHLDDLQIGADCVEPPAETCETVIPRPGGQSGVDDLPLDAVSRVELIRRLCGAIVELDDDGTFVSVVATLPKDPQRADDVLERLEQIVADFRVRVATGGEPVVELRFYRDGCPDGFVRYAFGDDAWKHGEVPAAIDLDDVDCSVEELDSVVADMLAARAKGRPIALLNVPTDLRVYVEASAEGRELSKRYRPGPQLPAVLAKLWS